MTDCASRGLGEAEAMSEARGLLGALIARDDWLPDECAAPHPEHYQQYLLYCDPLERFSLVSFVWGPGQSTPIHDHTVWGLIGMLRGAEVSQAFDVSGDGGPVPGETVRLDPGRIEAVSPAIGDVHRVSNAYDDRVSISIHLYGANIGAVRRHVFDPVSGAAKDFVSGYASAWVPNLWDRSRN
jgi:predicted metal-dependent enzyme (double-stranded beta helix superfamily)